MNRTCLSEISRGDRIRTCDHLVPNQVRYRTALRPESLRMKFTHLQSDAKVIIFLQTAKQKSRLHPFPG